MRNDPSPTFTEFVNEKLWLMTEQPPGWQDTLADLEDQYLSLDHDHLRCDYCTLPAVCHGARLVQPMDRCPRCCRRDRQFGGSHGPDDYLEAHLEAEGHALYTGEIDA